MAIVQCPECNGDVSTTADSCPHCGYVPKHNRKAKKKTGKKSQRQSIGCGGGIVIISCLICAVMSYQDCQKKISEPTTTNTTSTTKPQKNSYAKTGDESNAQLPEGDGWRVIKYNAVPSKKLAFDVSLKQKLTKPELEKIAKQLVSKDHERTFIGYYIDNKSKDAYWATSNANPDLEIKILGIPKGFVFKKSKTKGKLLGKWNDESLKRQLRMFKTKRGYVVENVHTDNSRSEVKLKKKSNTSYCLVEEPDVCYVNNGARLEAWSSNGLFATYDPA